MATTQTTEMPVLVTTAHRGVFFGFACGARCDQDAHGGEGVVEFAEKRAGLY